MQVQPRTDSITIVHRPTQFMRVPVGIPRFESFAIYVQYIPFEVQVTVRIPA